MWDWGHAMSHWRCETEQKVAQIPHLMSWWFSVLNWCLVGGSECFQVGCAMGTFSHTVAAKLQLWGYPHGFSLRYSWLYAGTAGQGSHTLFPSQGWSNTWRIDISAVIYLLGVGLNWLAHLGEVITSILQLSQFYHWKEDFRPSTMKRL